MDFWGEKMRLNHLRISAAFVLVIAFGMAASYIDSAFVDWTDQKTYPCQKIDKRCFNNPQLTKTKTQFPRPPQSGAVAEPCVGVLGISILLI